MQRVKSLVLICATGAMLTLAGTGPAGAEDGVTLGRNASECEIAAALGVARPDCHAAPARTDAKKPAGTRGLAIGGVESMPEPPPPPATRPASTGATRPHATAPRHTAPSASFPFIRFEFGTAAFTDDSVAMLDTLGRVIGAAAPTTRWRIVGHTDGVGSSIRNQKLSEERAQAVREYLSSHFQIDTSRMEAIGRGARELANPRDPAAAENRRVQLVKIGG